jgi:hypothetical protein
MRMVMDTSSTDTFKPPYMAFATFWSFIGFLAERPLPPRIDRSIMGNRSGTDQANLMATLKAFGLIDTEHKVQPALIALAVSDEVARREQLSALVRASYPGPVQVSAENGTDGQLNEAFRDDFGLTAAETRRKCVTFFLHALREAVLPVSANFPQTRSGSGGPGIPKSKTPRAAARQKAAQQAATPPPKSGKGDTYAVTLVSGGTVSVEVSVNLFDLSTQDREFVIKLVDALKGYAESNPGASVPAST